MSTQPLSTPADLRPAPDGRRDGRHLRTERTRQAIVEAYTDLLGEGDHNPSAQAVAARAGVGLRTVYNQFADIETVRAEAGVAVYRRLEPLLLRRADIRPGASFEERVELFLDRRLQVLRSLDPFALSAQGRHARSPALLENRRMLVEGSLAEIRMVFWAELRPLPARRRQTLLHALHMATSWPAFLALHEELALPPAGVRAAMSEALRRLLDPTGNPQPTPLRISRGKEQT